MRVFDEPDGFDVVTPQRPITVSLELSPEEIELAFATNAGSLRLTLLTRLVLAMIDDQSLAVETELMDRACSN